MDAVTIGIIGMIVFFILLAMGMSIGACMAFVGFVGFVFIISWGGATTKLAIVPFSTTSGYELAVIPLFIFMAHICFSSGFTRDLYDVAYKWLGRLPGGIAMASIAACAIFAAISASSIATAVTLGLVALPEMRKHGYADSLATGAIAAGGTMGSMIPPSAAFIMYGIMTQNSIGKLFMAGIIPGITQALLYIAAIFIVCRIKPSLGPKGPSSTWTEKFKSILKCGEIAVLILLVLGGLFIGWFTPTEAGAVGVMGAFLISFVRKRFSWKTFKEGCFETAKTTGMIYFLVIGAFMMNYFLAASTIPTLFAEYVGGLEVSRWVIFFLILIVYLILGCFIDALAMILLTLPVFYPIMMSLGFHPIFFGVIAVLMGEVAVITPPVGMNVFAISGIVKVPMATIYKGIVPFFIADVILLVLLITIPPLSLWLPSLMK
jgi:C4-dicarboxylate transporter, DctM subunit